MAWTDEMVDQLRAMWAEGLTTGEIGKRLSVSKNSIVGKVHRLGLSGRPSPIKKKEVTPSTEVEAEAKPAKEKIQKEKTEIKTPKVKAETPAAESAPQAEAKTIERIAPTVSPSIPRSNNGKTMLTDLDNHTCRWPLGDPKDENFHFCGKKVRIGQTYCDEHSAVAYVKTSKK